MTLVPSLDLVRRVVDVDLAYTLARMRVLERLEGNPIGIAYHTVGNVTALLAKNLPAPPFNRVVGLRRGHAHHIEPLVEWYRSQGGTARFEFALGDDDPDLERELARLGFFQSGCHAGLVGDPADVAPESEAAIERVTTADAMEAFLAAYVAGWEIPEAWHEQFKSNVRPWLHEPAWSLYLARIDDQPAAAAILYMRDGVGYLADGATRPVYRGRGLHAALLRRRIADARGAGAEFVCSGATFLSTSHRNMERVGMRLLFLRTLWTRLD